MFERDVVQAGLWCSNIWNKNLLYGLWHSYLMDFWLLNKINVEGYDFVWKNESESLKYM